MIPKLATMISPPFIKNISPILYFVLLFGKKVTLKMVSDIFSVIYNKMFYFTPMVLQIRANTSSDPSPNFLANIYLSFINSS